MSLPDFLAVLVIFILLPELSIMAVMLLRRSRARPMLKVLRSNALVALWLTAVVAVHAAIYLNNGMADPILEPYWTMVVSRSALLSLAIPVTQWVYVYRPRRP